MQDLDYLDSILENEQRIPLDVRRHLQSSNQWQRSDGVDYISYLPWNVAGPILEAMAEKDPHWDVRQRVAYVLRHYASELSNPLLEKMAKADHDDGVCKLAHETLRVADRQNMNGRDGVAKLKEDFHRYPDPVREKIMKDVLALVRTLNGNGTLANGLNGKAKANDLTGQMQTFKIKA